MSFDHILFPWLTGSPQRFYWLTKGYLMIANVSSTWHSQTSDLSSMGDSPVSASLLLQRSRLLVNVLALLIFYGIWFGTLTKFGGLILPIRILFHWRFSGCSCNVCLTQSKDIVKRNNIERAHTLILFLVCFMGFSKNHNHHRLNAYILWRGFLTVSLGAWLDCKLEFRIRVSFPGCFRFLTFRFFYSTGLFCL